MRAGAERDRAKLILAKWVRQKYQDFCAAMSAQFEISQAKRLVPCRAFLFHICCLNFTANWVGRGSERESKWECTTNQNKWQTIKIEYTQCLLKGSVHVPGCASVCVCGCKVAFSMCFKCSGWQLKLLLHNFRRATFAFPRNEAHNEAPHGDLSENWSDA